MSLGIGIVIANSSEIIWTKVISILISIRIVLLIILYQIKRTFDIKFLENEIINLSKLLGSLYFLSSLYLVS
mgnify:CR=1 FL=1